MSVDVFLDDSGSMHEGKVEAASSASPAERSEAGSQSAFEGSAARYKATPSLYYQRGRKSQRGISWGRRHGRDCLVHPVGRQLGKPVLPVGEMQGGCGRRRGQRRFLPRSRHYLPGLTEWCKRQERAVSRLLRLSLRDAFRVWAFARAKGTVPQRQASDRQRNADVNWAGTGLGVGPAFYWYAGRSLGGEQAKPR